MNIPKYSKLFVQIVRETSVRESDCPGNVLYGKQSTSQATQTSGKRLVRENDCPGKVLSGKRLVRKRLSGKVTVRETSVTRSSGRQPNFAALNRGRHLYSAGRPSRWALAHISDFFINLISASASYRLLT